MASADGIASAWECPCSGTRRTWPTRPPCRRSAGAPHPARAAAAGASVAAGACSRASRMWVDATGTSGSAPQRERASRDHGLPWSERPQHRVDGAYMPRSRFPGLIRLAGTRFRRAKRTLLLTGLLASRLVPGGASCFPGTARTRVTRAADLQGVAREDRVRPIMVLEAPAECGRYGWLMADKDALPVRSLHAVSRTGSWESPREELLSRGWAGAAPGGRVCARRQSASQPRWRGRCLHKPRGTSERALPPRASRNVHAAAVRASSRRPRTSRAAGCGAPRPCRQSAGRSAHEPGAPPAAGTRRPGRADGRGADTPRVRMPLAVRRPGAPWGRSLKRQPRELHALAPAHWAVVAVTGPSARRSRCSHHPARPRPHLARCAVDITALSPSQLQRSHAAARSRWRSQQSLRSLSPARRPPGPCPSSHWDAAPPCA